ncbi:MAG: prephenate dehydrogenase/arogenate dehydrogenase family protein [Clostridioides sp.]|jgi:prephenate dehydrogenase|nr:prephenate dehydrogenase/arogenate dehydrogenase family protein [Clostridioides sp.]
MNVGIIGMGLIGGSMAKSIKQKTEHKVFGWDKSELICNTAILTESVHDIIKEGDPSECDLIIIALYPKATVEYVEKFASHFKKDAIVVDCSGVKRSVCKPIQSIAEKNGFVFCGAHPMAGIERSGFTYSTSSMFDGATMIFTPYTGTNIALMHDLSLFFKSIGFSRIQIATDVEHDQMVAYTSQLAHVVSSAYIKSELSPKFKGFSAGSFHDMTRVAKLNETMWTELFLENSDFLATEIDGLIQRLQEYSKVIKEKDENTLKSMLKEGKEKRLAVDEVKEFE